MAQDTTPAIIVYQGDGSNSVFDVPFDKGYYGEIKVLFVRRGLADYTYNPNTFTVSGRLYAWQNGGAKIYTHTPNPAIGAPTYNSSDVEQAETVSAVAGQTITVDSLVYSRAVQHDISSNMKLTWTGDMLEVGDFICIVRDTERGQPYEMPNNQKHIERALDNIERQVQEVKDATDNALKIDPSHDILDSHKMNPIDWLKSIIRCMDFSVRAVRLANGWFDYSADDPNIADADKTWVHLLNTDNIKNIRERSDVVDGVTIYWTEYQASDGTWRTLANTSEWDRKIQYAKDTADEAKETAEYAQNVAEDAKDIAEDAKETAEGIEGIAQEALDKVTQEITDREDADEDLQDQINNLSGRGRFLALWNCATGLAESNPPESPYPYKAGDYFVVGTVSSADPAVNYKPDGSSYTTGVASTTVETNEVSVNDTYFYDGAVWRLQSNAQKEVSFSALAGSPYDNTALGNALDSKQDTLTAGTNIDITNNVISATSVESFFRGKWTNWASVPTTSSLYPTDYTGNHTPTEGDYMVVLDASGYVREIGSVTENSVQGLLNENNGNVSPNETWRTSDFLGVIGGNTIDYTYTRVYTGAAGNRCCFYDSNKSFIRSVSVPGTTGPGTYTYQVVVPANAVYVRFSYIKSDYDIVASYDSVSTLSGGWRFGYHGVWEEDNKNGWLPEYQIEDVLPTADSATAGIAKLYTTTGSNTDGAIDQNGTTTAINTAVSTHNTDTTAHSNIRGTANGIATLDGNAKVPLSQMNDALLGNVSYQGLWNAATNDPFLIDPSGGLPAGYNAIEYINFDNGQYIDTGVSIDSTFDTIEYDIKFLIDRATNIFPFGSSQENYYGGSGCPIFSGWSNNAAVANYFVANNPGIAMGTAINLNTENYFSIVVDIAENKISATQNGILGTSQYTGTIYENSITLGCLHAGNARSFHLFGRIYYFAIKKNGISIRQYQPAIRLSDNAYGFYEMVSGTFVTATGGTFTSGGGQIEIPKGHYYITSVAGTQFGIHFEVGDWVISTGSAWSKVDNTDAVSSVEGRTGNVTVINDSASTGATTYTWSADKLTTEFGSLGTAAYTASTDYATAAQGAKADTALQPADVVEYTANEVETLWNSI